MNKKLWYLLACLALVFTFALPEVFFNTTIDKGETPLRLYRGDVLHYLGILNAGRVSEGPAANAYFAEWSRGLSNFQILQTAISFAPGVDALSVVWLMVILQVLVAIGVFLVLARLLRFFDVPENTAALAAFLFVLCYGPMAFRGSALASWFFPFLLLGIYFVLRFFIEKNSIPKNAALLLGALGCFSLQPIYFFLGLGITSLIWILKLHEDHSRRMVYLFFVWLTAVATVFFCLFWPFISGIPGSADILERLVSTYTRIPFHPLIMAKFLLIAVIGGIVLWSTRPSGVVEKRWFAVGVLAFTAFLGISSYLITGKYVANDHYAIIEDVTAFLLLATILYSPRAVFHKSHKIAGGLLFFVALASFLDVAQYLDFGIGYSGKFIGYHFAYFLTALILLFPQATRSFIDRLESFRRPISAVLISLVLIYANVLFYKDGQAHRADHERAQLYRPLVEALSALPPGVVLGDAPVSNLTTLFTKHKVYWHYTAYGERIPTSELYKRFLDANLFFSDDRYFQGNNSVNGVYGTTNHCTEYKRDRYLTFLADLGYSGPYAALCTEREVRRAAWEKSLTEEKEAFAKRVAKTGIWKPQYKLTYLVRAPLDAAIPEPLVTKYFSKLQEIPGGFTIYTLK